MAFNALTSHFMQDGVPARVAQEHSFPKDRQLDVDQLRKGQPEQGRQANNEKKASGHKFRICNAATGDERCCVEVSPQMTVLELKAAIEQETGLVKHAQRLIFEFSILHNKQILGNAAPEMFGNSSTQLFLIRRGCEKQLRTLAALDEYEPQACTELYQLATRYGLADLQFDRHIFECLPSVVHRLRFNEPDDMRHRDAEFSMLRTWLQEDDEFLRMALEIDSSIHIPFRGGSSPIALLILVIARSKIQENEELASELMQDVGDPLFLASLLPNLMSVPSVVEVAVQRDGLALRYASHELRADARIVRLAIRQNGMALEHAAPALKADPGIVLTAVSNAGLALGHAAAPLRASQRIVERAVETDPMALRFAHQTIQTNRKIVSEAVRRKGAALEFASSELQSHRSIVLSAVSQDGRAFRFASDTLRSDFAMVQDAIAISHEAFSYAAPELQANKLVSLFAAKGFLAIGEPTFDDRHVLGEQAIVSQIEARVGKFVSAAPKPLLEALCQIHPVAVAAVKHSLSTWERLSMEMRADREVALAAVKKDSSMFSKLPNTARRDLTIMVAAALQDDLTYSLILKTDVWMVRSAVSKLKAAQGPVVTEEAWSRCGV